MQIYFAGDHAGFLMKQQLIEFARSLGHEVKDLGPFSYDEKDDFPDYVIPLAKKVGEAGFIPPFLKEVPESARTEDLNPSAHQNEPLPLGKGELRKDEVRGIIVAASGQAEAMCANRFKGVRAAVYYGPVSKTQTDADGKVFDLLASTRQHNNANILSLGARFMTAEEAKEAVRIFLETPFSGDERHIRRIRKMDSLL